MTPAISSIDSTEVDLGDLADYTITSAAIPLDVSDSSGSVTSFTTTHAVKHQNSAYAIGQNLTLETGDGGVFEGKVTTVGAPGNGVMSLTADTLMASLAVDKRVYPIYQGFLSDKVSVAVEHWTQTAGIFYDRVPGKVISYHSFFGHDYVYGTIPEQRPRLRNLNTTSTLYQEYDGRLMMRLLRGDRYELRTATMQKPDAMFPATDNVPISPYTAEEQMVFSQGFAVQGEGHSGMMVWHMNSARADQLGGKPVQLRILWGNTSGFTVQLGHPGGSTYNLLPATGALAAGNYRVLIGVREHPIPDNTLFTIRIINETTGALAASRDVYATTPLRGSQVQLSHVAYTVDAAGSDTFTEWGLYGYFVSAMPAGQMPSAPLLVNKDFDSSSVTAQAIVPGFSGDVWTHIKSLLALHKRDFWFEDGKLFLRPMEQNARDIGELSRVTPSVTQREAARHVEVVVRNMNSYYAQTRVMFAADSVYQVSTGEVQTFTAQTEHSIDSVLDPTCVSGITPYPYKFGGGQYVITGSDGYIVSPEWWRDNGGKIMARTTEREGEIEVTIKGPDYDSPRAPYRVSEGDAGRPALYITGTGVTSEPETLKIATGHSRAVADVGETIDNPFITNRDLAFRAAMQVALKYASPQLKLSGSEPKTYGGSGALSRKGAGALFEFDGNIYRVSGLTQTARANSFTDAVQHTTIRHRNEAFPGRTIRDANQAHANRTIKDRALKPLRRS